MVEEEEYVREADMQVILDEALDGSAGEIRQTHSRDNAYPLATPHVQHGAEGKRECAHASVSC